MKLFNVLQRREINSYHLLLVMISTYFSALEQSSVNVESISYSRFFVVDDTPLFL